jgi:hypothetical protein
VAVAVGSRAHLETAALAERTRLRNFLMHGFHALVTFVAGHQVNDTQCGFKVGAAKGPACSRGQGTGGVGLVWAAIRVLLSRYGCSCHWSKALEPGLSCC